MARRPWAALCAAGRRSASPGLTARASPNAAWSLSTRRSSTTSGRSRSGNQHPTGDPAVALPERDLAGEQRVIWRGLEVAVRVVRPRPDRVLAGCGVLPATRPEPPGELPRLAAA